jgi:putative ATPase
LLSRCRVHVLDAVSVDDIVQHLRARWSMTERGLGDCKLDASRKLAGADRQGRRRRRTPRADLLEIAAELPPTAVIDDATLTQVLADRTRRFDKRRRAVLRPDFGAA